MSQGADIVVHRDVKQKLRIFYYDLMVYSHCWLIWLNRQRAKMLHASERWCCYRSNIAVKFVNSTISHAHTIYNTDSCFALYWNFEYCALREKIVAISLHFLPDLSLFRFPIRAFWQCIGDSYYFLIDACGY